MENLQHQKANEVMQHAFVLVERMISSGKFTEDQINEFMDKISTYSDEIDRYLSIPPANLVFMKDFELFQGLQVRGLVQNRVRVVFANFPYVSAPGQYEYTEISENEAWMIAKNNCQHESAVGHQATADLISELLEVECKVNRINFVQKLDDLMLVFKLNKRQPEGAILNRETVQKVGYSWGILKKIS
jgi:hypothetical protein